MYPLLMDRQTLDVRNRASVMKILFKTNETLAALAESPMLERVEQDGVKAAERELQTLIDRWITEVEIERTLKSPERLVEKPKRTGRPAANPRRGARALLAMLEIFQGRRMHQEDYTAIQQSHILVAVQNLVDALDECDPEVLSEVG